MNWEVLDFWQASHLGVPPYLNNYDIEFYNQLGVVNYGNTVGNDMKNVISNLGGANQLHWIILQGSIWKSWH